MGPRTDPWGTPFFMNFIEEFLEPILMYWVRKFK